MGLKRRAMVLGADWIALATELESSLRGQGDDHLADEIAQLPIVGYCRCFQANCCTFNTGRATVNDSVLAASSPGWIAIDLDAERGIVGVEILDRPDLRPAYLKLRRSRFPWL